jgi:ubiquitin-like 1-activating enzyme E1 A
MSFPEESELYDRQIRLWGVEAQARIQGSKVLCVGLGGLGAECMKNLCLAGISATIVDDGTVSADDTASNFFLSLDDVGLNRAVAAHPRIKELNKHVSVDAIAGSLASLDDAFILRHNVVLLTRSSQAEQLRLDDLCRSKGAAFFCADVFGYEGILFSDLGRHMYRTESGTGATSKLSEPIVSTFPTLAESYGAPWADLSNKRFGPVSPAYVKFRILGEFRNHHARPATATDADEVLAIGIALHQANGLSAPFSAEDARALAATATVRDLLDSSRSMDFFLVLQGAGRGFPRSRRRRRQYL